VVSDAWLEEMDRQIDANIKQYGWHTTGVFPTADDPLETASFAYTAGLAEIGHPEIITFSLPAQVAHGILGTFVERVRDNKERCRPGPAPDILRNYEGWLVEVPESVVSSYFGVALRRARGRTEGFAALQFVWPDKDGRFPWDEGYKYPKWVQPVLGERPK
jgi:hypothetical protein